MSIKNTRPTVALAIRSISNRAVSFNMDGDEIISWDTGNTGFAQPTQSEIDTEFNRLQADYDAQDYARKRKAEYPSIQDLVVALYDTEDKLAIETKRAEIKLKYPKPI